MAASLLGSMATRLALTLACLCMPGISAQPDDEVALVQLGLEVHSRRRQVPLQGRAALLVAVASGPASDLAFNCTQYPDFCRAPFNCQDWVPSVPGGAKDGHSNFQTWCGSPQYYDYLTTCIQKKDLRKAGRIQYQWSVDEGKGITELDGSYCFMEGHCTNTAVTVNTTVEEAEEMCDARYGHNGWVQFEMPPLASLMKSPAAASPTTGFHDESITKAFLKLACVMGNYHCDVMYCKETYCQKEYFVKKYKHLLPITPGHLIRQP